MRYEEMTIAVGDAKPGDLYDDPELGEVMIRSSVPARAFSLFVGVPKDREPEPWALVVLRKGDPKTGIGFKDGRNTPIVVRRPYLSQASDRAHHLADLRRTAIRLQRGADQALKQAREYENGKRLKVTKGVERRDFSASGGTPLTYEERAMAQRLLEEYPP